LGFTNIAVSASVGVKKNAVTAQENTTKQDSNASRQDILSAFL